MPSVTFTETFGIFRLTPSVFEQKTVFLFEKSKKLHLLKF